MGVGVRLAATGTAGATVTGVRGAFDARGGGAGGGIDFVSVGAGAVAATLS